MTLNLLRVALITAAVLSADVKSAEPPRLNGATFLQSPVAVEPGGLLLLSGSGLKAQDRVAYLRLRPGDSTPPAPAAWFGLPDSLAGFAEIVSVGDTPHSLVVRVPETLDPDATYALSVFADGAAYSNPVLVNDPRPLWFTPSEWRRTDRSGAATLRIVGRNLGPRYSRQMRIRLEGARTVPLPTARLWSRSPIVADYVLAGVLPASLPAGDYSVAVSVDGVRWVSVPDQRLHVGQSSSASASVSLGDAGFGACRPDDGRDDSRCLSEALTHLAAIGAGTLRIGAGTWDLLEGNEAQLSAHEGLVVAEGIDLIGAGATRSRIVRHAGWLDGPASPVLTLTGRNTLRGLHFDDKRSPAQRSRSGPTVRFGQLFYRGRAERKRMVEDLQILECRFTGGRHAMADAGLPLRRITIEDNEIRADDVGLWLGGNSRNLQDTFALQDAVVRRNRFFPGQSHDPARGTGSIATVIGAATRLDFSENVADGSASLRLPGDSTSGWRAAFFSHLLGEQDRVLIAGNFASCSGDQAGDGEAIALDNNHNSFAYDSVRSVIAASPGSVKVAGPLRTRQRGQQIVKDSFYVGHWLQIVDGSGVGQSRRVESYSTDSDSDETSWHVAPAWETPPVPGHSRVQVARVMWQVYIVGNEIDHRSPLCANRRGPSGQGGRIAIWAQTSDSVVAGNVQHGADGILWLQNYRPQAIAGMAAGSSLFQYHLLIAGNKVFGERYLDSNCSQSGVQGWFGLPPGFEGVSPTLSYGVQISGNEIRSADGLGAAAITIQPGWAEGRRPQRSRLVRQTIVDRNEISGLPDRAAGGTCDRTDLGRAAISIAGRQSVFGTVLSGNRCGGAGFRDTGESTRSLCRAKAALDCGCAEGQR